MSTPITIQSEKDVLKAFDAGIPGSRMRWVWILGLGGIFFEAYSGAALATGLEPLAAELALSPLQISMVTSTYMVMAILLCPPFGALADRFGRIRIILIAKLVAAAAMLIGFTAMNFEMLIISRVLAGIAWAMDFGVVLAYIAEFLSRRNQSKLNRWQGMWYVATTSNLLVAVVIYQFGVGGSIWRWLLASAGVIAVALFILQIIFLPESPRWLASKGRFAAATKSINATYSVDAIAGEDQRQPTTKTAGSGTTKTSFTEIFRGKYLRRTVLANVAFAGQAWQYYAIGWYLPIIALELFGEGFVAASLGAAAFNAIGIIGGLASASIAAKLRIRRSIKIGFGVCTVVLVVFGLTFGSLPLMFAVLLPALFILFQSGFAGPGGASLSALAYPSRLRALGAGFATTACNIGAALGLFTFPLLTEALGTSGAIVVTAAVPLAGFIVASIIRWDPELTQDADAEEEEQQESRELARSVAD